MGVYEKGLITVLACDAVLALVAVPLALRKIRRNVVYGFRTRATLADDFVWYEANAHFGRGLLIASGLSAAAILLLYVKGGLSPDAFFKASIVALVAPSLVAAIATFRFVRSLKARETDIRPR
jgi:SdpI/YfhL protein family